MRPVGRILAVGASAGAALLVLLSLLLTLQSAVCLMATLYVWEERRASDGGRVPRPFATPLQRFTLVLTADRDAAAVEAALHRMVALRYPRELVQLLVVVAAADTGTIARARETLAALARQGSRSVRLLIVGDPPFTRPHGLNVGLRAATGDVVGVFDSGDELHPDILNVVNSVVAREGAARTPVLHCGSLPTRGTDPWFFLPTAVEGSFWSWSRRHHQAAVGVVPLGGGTVFIQRDLLRRIGGWDERCSAEDADLALRLTAERVPVRVLADAEHATRRPVPATVAQLMRQRTDRDQGLLRLVATGAWQRLPSWPQRLVALGALVSPLVLPLALLYVAVGLWLMLSASMNVNVGVGVSGGPPVAVVLVGSLPLYAALVQLLVQILGLRELARVTGLPAGPGHVARLVAASLPYQGLLALAAGRATWRALRDRTVWRPTIQRQAPGAAAGSAAARGGHRRPRLAVSVLAERWPVPRAEMALLLLLLTVALLAHGVNLFDSSAARDDEGIYTARAWAVLREHRLAPATGGYDHAPAGWLLLAGWMAATGGPLAFGGALDSGRACMLALHLGTVILLYRVARKLGCGLVAAALACLLFSLSPLAVFYQRLVLLDNVMLFWALLSLDLVLDNRRRLSRLALGGACFGLACLSKETAGVLAPALLLVVWQQRREQQERVALASWLAPLLVVLSWYPLYAALEGQLLPAGQWVLPLMRGWAADGASAAAGAPRWSQLLGLGGLVDGDNGLWQLVQRDWSARDPVLVVGGVLATGVNVVRGGALRPVRDPRALVAGFLALLPLLYLGRAGAVRDFHVLAALPFLCLSLAVALAPLLAHLRGTWAAAVAAVVVSALAAGYWEAGTLQPLYAQRPGAAARAATAWIKQNLPPESRILTPGYLWTDLHEPSADGPGFPRADTGWTAASDAAVPAGAAPDDWHAADYVVVAPPAESHLTIAVNVPQVGGAHLVRRWQQDGAALELWRVGRSGATASALPARSAGYIVRHFERAGAYVAADGSVSAEGQADALLRDVWSNDRADFDSTWGWTAAHLLRADGLPAWLWRSGAIVDPHSASDADVDLALALLMAGRRWHEPAWVQAGTRLVQAIWQGEVVLVAGAPVVAAGEWAADARTALVPVNPSYFAPYAYRVFQEVDPGHDWSAVIDAGYRTLFALSQAPLGGGQSALVPPDWVGLDRGTGEPAPLPVVGKRDMTVYGYDAPRTFWRVALDLRWTGDPRAAAYLRQADLLRREVSLRGAPGACYTHAGALVDDRPSMVGTAGALAALLTLDPEAADALYTAQVLGGAEGAAWADRADLYDQSWGWFAAALYADALPDLWHAA